MEQTVQQERFETEQTIEKRVKWLTWVIIAIAFPVAGWVTAIQLTQDDHGEKISSLERVDKDRLLLMHTHELRVQRVEDANAHILKALDRIEKHLGTNR